MKRLSIATAHALTGVPIEALRAAFGRTRCRCCSTRAGRFDRETLIALGGLVDSLEAARILGISRTLLYQRVHHGHVPTVKLPGARLLFRRSDLENIA